MRTLPGFTFLALGLSLLARHVAAQTTTIGDREEDLADPQFIGYYIAPSSIQRMTASTFWVTSGKFAGDCDSDFDSCVVATDCFDDTIYFGGGSYSSCGTRSCVSMTIFQTFPDGLPSATNIECRQHWRAYTVYRELEVSSTESETSSTFAESTSNERSIAEATPSETTSATSAGATASAEPTSEPKKSKSKAWIAGAVVGSIAGLAVIAGAGWFYMRSQNQAKSDPIALTLQPRMKEEPPVEMPGH